MEDTGLLISRVRALLDDAVLPEVEDTLMDGYARALVLEGERAQLARRVDELTSGLEAHQFSERLSELESLKLQMARVDEELSSLRSALAEARERYAANAWATAAESPLA